MRNRLRFNGVFTPGPGARQIARPIEMAYIEFYEAVNTAARQYQWSWCHWLRYFIGLIIGVGVVQCEHTIRCIYNERKWCSLETKKFLLPAVVCISPTLETLLVVEDDLMPSHSNKLHCHFSWTQTILFAGQDFSSAEMLLEALFEEEDAQMLEEEEEMESTEDQTPTPPTLRQNNPEPAPGS